MKLNETVDLMVSDDYKDRFIAEYSQLKTRKESLDSVISKRDSGTLEFDLSCPVDILRTQSVYMGLYLDILKKRAEIEKIKMPK